MNGYWVDLDGGKMTFDPTTFGFGPIDMTWQRIQARKELLACGGEEADRLIQQELEDEIKEIERQKRRECHQRSKMYKLERLQ